MQQEQHDGGGAGGRPLRSIRGLGGRTLSGRTQSVVGVSASKHGGTEDWTDDFDLALPTKPPSPGPPSPVSASLKRIAKQGVDAPRHRISSVTSSTANPVRRSVPPPSSVQLVSHGFKSPGSNPASASKGSSGSTNAVSSRHRSRKDPSRDSDHHGGSRSSQHRRHEERESRSSSRKNRQDGARVRGNSRTETVRSSATRVGSGGEEMTMRRRRSREEKVPAHVWGTLVTAPGTGGKESRGGERVHEDLSGDVNDSPTDSEVMPAPQPRALRTSSMGFPYDRVCFSALALTPSLCCLVYPRRIFLTECACDVMLQCKCSFAHTLIPDQYEGFGRLGRALMSLDGFVYRRGGRRDGRPRHQNDRGSSICPTPMVLSFCTR